MAKRTKQWNDTNRRLGILTEEIEECMEHIRDLYKKQREGLTAFQNDFFRLEKRLERFEEVIKSIQVKLGETK